MDIEKYIFELRARGLSDEAIKQELEKVGFSQEYVKVPDNQSPVVEQKKSSFFARALLFSVYLFLLGFVAIFVIETLGQGVGFHNTLPSFFQDLPNTLLTTVLFSGPYILIMPIILFSRMEDKRSRRKAYLVALGVTVVGVIITMFFNEYVLLGLPGIFLWLVGVVALSRLMRGVFLFLRKKSVIFSTITTVVVLTLPFIFLGLVVWNDLGRTLVTWECETTVSEQSLCFERLAKREMNFGYCFRAFDDVATADDCAKDIINELKNKGKDIDPQMCPRTYHDYGTRNAYLACYQFVAVALNDVSVCDLVKKMDKADCTSFVSEK